MGELYLSSRTEVLRAMNIDTGRDIAIIGAPEDFMVWMNNILPIHFRIACAPSDLDVEEEFDIILWWTPNELDLTGMNLLMDRLSQKGDLWVIVKRELQIDEYRYESGPGKVSTMMITTALDLVPVIIRSIS